MGSYSFSYKVLHWSMALLIFIMFLALQGFQPDMSDADRAVMLIGHSSIGTVITMLMVLRFTKRFVLHHPRPRQNLKANQAMAAKIVHLALYALMIVVPLTGYLAANFHHLPVQVFGSLSLNGTADAQAFELIRNIHSLAVKSLMVLVLLHVVAALGHKFILKDRVLMSMRPWRSQ